MNTERKVEAFLIGESSAGMLALEIWENDTLVYSHNYFDEGANEKYYQHIIKEQAYQDMMKCENWRDFEGCALDEDGDVVEFDTGLTTMKTVSYSVDAGWQYLESDTMSDEFVIANAHRLPYDVVEMVDECGF